MQQIGLYKYRGINVHGVQFWRDFNQVSMKRGGRYTRAAAQQSHKDYDMIWDAILSRVLKS